MDTISINNVNIPDEVVRRFAYKRQLCLGEARRLFQELENYLDAAATKVSSPAPSIDEVWHEFILHTKDYVKFCQNRYGRLIHHVPTSPILCETEATGNNFKLEANLISENADACESCKSE